MITCRLCQQNIASPWCCMQGEKKSSILINIIHCCWYYLFYPSYNII